MYNRKPKNTLSEKKLTPHSGMTVRSRKKSNNSTFPDRSPARKSPWPSGIDNASSSWDGNSRTTSSSWPGDIEETATQKVLDLWYTVERTLYNEDEQVPLGNVMDECIQWRMQIPHFRVVGKAMTLEIADEESDNETSVRPKSQISTGKSRIENSIDERLQQKEEKSNSLSRRQLEVRDEVIELVVDYIWEELQKNQDNSISNSRDLEEVLRITPAPIYTGRKHVKIKKTSGMISRQSSANRLKSFELTERKNDNATSMKIHKNAKNACDDADDDDDDDDEANRLGTPQLGRNKLGTVFNQKIVVSPVPFAVTTRESFCTLKTTPIKYAGHLLELTTPQGISRHMNSASKVNSAQRTSLLRMPQRHSAWQTPICPAGWPKNVRLAPIDPSRLPSSKNRSSAVSPSVPHRHRNSLSPISRPFKITSVDNIDRENLEIQGRKIVTRSAKLNLSKTGWDRNPDTQKGFQKRSKLQSDR